MGAEGKIEFDRALDAVIRDALSDADIDAVHSRLEFDEDGDPVIRITVVFKTAKSFDAKKAKSLTHRIFPVLKNECRDAFPILSFLSKADHARVSAAA